MAKPKSAKPDATPEKPATPSKPSKSAAAKVPAAASNHASEDADDDEIQPSTPVIEPSKRTTSNGHGNGHAVSAVSRKPALPVEPTDPFLIKQRERLLALRDNILDSMNGVAKDTLRSRAEGSEASAFGMHQADAGSDAYDRDFALSLLSQEQDALYEIEEALKRIDANAYGTCEMSGKPIAVARLEAIPFARFTVECQAQIEKMTKIQRSRTPVTSLFGLTDSEDGPDNEEEETTPESKE